MKYEDDLGRHMVNGQYVGVREGTPMQDAANPGSDGYDHLRATNYCGSVMQDAQGINPTPKSE